MFQVVAPIKEYQFILSSIIRPTVTTGVREVGWKTSSSNLNWTSDTIARGDIRRFLSNLTLSYDNATDNNTSSCRHLIRDLSYRRGCRLASNIVTELLNADKNIDYLFTC